MTVRHGDPRSGIEKYLGPGEHVMCATRRHSHVLGSAIVVWLSALVLALATGIASGGSQGWHLEEVGAAIFLAATVFFAWRASQWWAARYAVTNHRVLFVEGILSQRIKGLP